MCVCVCVRLHLWVSFHQSREHVCTVLVTDSFRSCLHENRFLFSVIYFIYSSFLASCYFGRILILKNTFFVPRKLEITEQQGGKKYIEVA